MSLVIKNKKLFLCLFCAALLVVSMGCQFANNLLGTESGPDSSSQVAATSTNPETAVPAFPLQKATAIPPTEAEQPATGEPAESTAEPATPTSPPVSTETCNDEICIVPGNFLLARPIGPDGRNTIDHSFRFGEYHRATRRAHHGVDFLNSTGTPVLAAADGEVVVAGDDSQTPYAIYPDTYGNLVILEHHLPGIADTVYTLYAHLSQISVATGESVQAGQEIGQVGMSGNIRGSTLHFEVRLQDNNYQAARNPELWLELLPDENGQLQGALAGLILNSQGDYVHMPNIVIERLGGPGQPALDQLYLKTYNEDHLVGMSPWKESFAVGNLPAGSYQISFWLNGMQQKVVEVKPGKLTGVTFHVE